LDQVGLLFIAWSAGYLPGALVGGMLLDRHSVRLVFSLAGLIMGCGIAALFLALSLHIALLLGLIVCAGVAGFGGGISESATNGIISTIYAQKRGVALNLFTLLYPISSAVISFVDGGLFFLFHNDPRPPLIFTGFVITIAVLASLFVRYEASNGSQILQQKGEGLDLKDDHKRSELLRMLLPVLMVMLLVTGMTATIRTWTPAYLHVTYGQTPALAAILSGVMNGMVIGFRLLASLVVAAIGTRRTILLSLTIAIGGLIGVLLSLNVVWGIIAITVTAIGLTPIVATFVALGNEYTERSFGSVTGLLFFVVGISNIICSWLFGVLLNRLGPLWAVIFCLASLLCGMGAIFFLRPSHMQTDKQSLPMQKG
jgi:MFS family permease